MTLMPTSQGAVIPRFGRQLPLLNQTRNSFGVWIKESTRHKDTYSPETKTKLLHIILACMGSINSLEMVRKYEN